METIKWVSIICITLSISLCDVWGKSPHDSIEVAISFKDSSLLLNEPQLVLKKLGEENRIFLNPSYVNKNNIVFKFKKENFFESALLLKKSGRRLLFFISPESAKIKLTYEYSSESASGYITKVEGSRADADYRRFDIDHTKLLNSISSILVTKYEDYYKNYRREDVANERYHLQTDATFKLYKDLVRDTSYYTPFVYWTLYQNFDSFKSNEVRELLTSANPRKDDYYYNRITDLLKLKEKSLNSEASRKVLFSNKDLERAIKSASKKYIYLTFWASWCAPCRSHNKYLRTISNKSIEIIGVSLDSETTKMHNAITQDSIKQWKHVQLNDGFNSDITKEFGISGIPGNILLNEKREVIRINIPDEELNNLLFAND